MHSLRIALGTVQFGQRYGIANRQGQVSREEAAAIVHGARAAGVDTLDTAVDYGDSESRLGEIGVTGWRVISKLPPLPDICPDVAGWVRQTVADSLARLKIKRLGGLLLHRPQQLLGPQGESLHSALVALRDQGLVETIGVSIYDPAELDAIWHIFKPELVQAPFNVLDRRLRTSGWLARMHRGGVEVHVRSVFLQGLLLMDAARRPPGFNRWQPLWDQWHRWLADKGLTPLQACAGFALSQYEVSRVVVGVDSLKQLEEILGLSRAATPEPPPALASEDSDLVNPSRWVLE